MKYNFKIDNDVLRCKICNQKVSVCKTKEGWILSSVSEGDEAKGICHDCLVDHCCNTNCLGCDWYKYPNCPHIQTKKIYMEEINMRKNKKIAYTEYAVEVNNDKGFVRQIDMFKSYEEAKLFTEQYDEPLNDDQYLNIIFIDYDENENEIDFGTVC